MKCPYCGLEANDGDKYCIGCGKPLPDLRKVVMSLVLFSLMVFSALWLLKWLGSVFGIREAILSLAPIVAWSVDVLLKWSMGLAAHSSGPDLAFGAFSASAALLVSYYGQPVGGRQDLLFAVVVLGFLWLISLVFGVIADEEPDKLPDTMARVARVVGAEIALWYSILIGFASAIYVAYLLLQMGD